MLTAKDDEGDRGCWTCGGETEWGCECGWKGVGRDCGHGEYCPVCASDDENGDLDPTGEFVHEGACRGAALLRELTAIETETETETKQETTT